jgi:hypothetical protein
MPALPSSCFSLDLDPGILGNLFPGRDVALLVAGNKISLIAADSGNNKKRKSKGEYRGKAAPD